MKKLEAARSVLLVLLGAMLVFLGMAIWWLVRDWRGKVPGNSARFVRAPAAREARL